MNQRFNSFILIVFFSLTIGFFLRVLYYNKYPVQSRDAYYYIQDSIENSFLSEKGEYTPVLSLFLLALPHKILGKDRMCSRIITNMVLGLGFIVILIEIARQLFKNRMTMLFSGLLAATNPVLIDYSCKALRESSYVFFSGLIFLAYLKFIRKRDITGVIMMGLISACVILCRIEGVELLVISTFILVYSLYNTQNRTKKTAAYIALYFFIVLLSIGVINGMILLLA